MTQLGLLTEIERIDKPRKRVRQVSVQGYADLRGNVEQRREFVLRKLAAFWNRYQQSPTCAELTDWLWRSNQIDRNDPNIVRPRVTELVDLGVCKYGDKRIDRVTRKSARPISIVEIGADRGR